MVKLVSADGSFELGFFSPDRSKSRYLEVCDQGILALQNSTKSIVWSSNTSRTAHNPVAQLLESGNFAVKDRNESSLENLMSQSIDYPRDNFLPGMKLGRNFDTGFEIYISSWKSIDDPAQGEYSLRIDHRGLLQIVVRKESETLFRSGAWNGHYFLGRKPNLKSGTLCSYELVLNRKEIYFKYELQNNSILLRYAMNPSGLMQRFTWNERNHDWLIFFTPQADQCATYALCGAYATCSTNGSLPCECLEGFVPKTPAFRDWNTGEWSEGCLWRTPLVCDGGDGFLKQTLLKFPDTSHAWANNTMSYRHCIRRFLHYS
ncbi:G-type lectin S-receptor-like serine/threonine-protein kinase At4g27290 [Herrania umbratica]|uniref:G-type lectin S-receptor-like serine/threonine-protein kinase At4g27290 n=1 Tax=Herrania umbratica TaxID=108875 RepID=A0A6J1AJJ4_9ROSI|nr:G-type lectin S-receptor-like serine/threonine-protein kinase At4g27290 [Herrania umbratica]